MPSFDNRTLISRTHLDKLLKGIANHKLSGQAHFKLLVGGKTIVYCYIRKNGCTAFKRLFVDFSPHSGELKAVENPIVFMNQYHLVKTQSDIEAADHTIFVYRDPVERIASLFVNKFILHSGYKDIFNSFYKNTRILPQDARFIDFVFDYLGETTVGLDPHVFGQAAHLHKIRYTDAISLVNMHRSMTGILGRRIADCYFKEKVNSAQNGQCRYEQSVADVPSQVLRETFEKSGCIPSYKDLLTEEIRAHLAKLYRDDLDLINKVGAASK